MSEDTFEPKALEPQAASGEDEVPITTRSNQWEMKAAMLARDPDNKDVHVQVTQPMFDKVSCIVTFLAPDIGEVDDGKGVSARLKARIEETITSVEGVQKTAGWIFSDRPLAVMTASRDAKAVAAAERGCRDVGRALIAAGLMRRGDEPALPEFVRLIGQLDGKRAMMKLNTRQGTKKDPDTGEFPVFQNVQWAAAGDAKNAREAAETNAGNY